MAGRYGEESGAKLARTFASLGVSTYLVEEVHLNAGRWYADIIDPYTGQTVDHAICACGEPPVAPTNKTIDAYIKEPESCLQATVIRHTGTDAPVVIGWIPPHDSTKNPGNIKKAKQRSTGGQQPVSGLPQNPCAGFLPPTNKSGTLERGLEAKDGKNLISSNKFALLKLTGEGRAGLAVLNRESPPDQRIILQLYSSRPGSEAGAIVLTKLKGDGSANCAPSERALAGVRTQNYLLDLQEQVNALTDLVDKLAGAKAAELTTLAATAPAPSGVKAAKDLVSLKAAQAKVSKNEVPSGNDSLLVEWIHYSEDV